jgi:inner membrane protein
MHGESESRGQSRVMQVGTIILLGMVLATYRMQREGHYGAALLAYAPLGAVTLALGFRVAAIGGALVAIGLAMVPDYDLRIPGIKHRGVTHTVRFAAVVAIALGLLGAGAGTLHPSTGPLSAVGIGVFAAAVGGVTILSHIAADALTPMGVEPFGDDGEHISYDVCRADSTLGNYALLVLGIVGAFLALGAGNALNGMLPV